MRDASPECLCSAVSERLMADGELSRLARYRYFGE
jgi:hypothetical protein